ncbi:protein rep, partial [Merismopedia glauca]
MKPSNENGSSHSAAESYLSTISPQDKDWDIYKTLNNVLRELYKGTSLDTLPSRLDACSGFLEFGITPPLDDGSVRLKLRSARFCRVRHCPVCQSRRSSMWFARLINSIPLVEKDYPKARYIFLTLTLKNCRVEELKDTIKWMNKSWIKLTKKKCFPGIGYVKSTEVTRNREEGTVHPHFHILIMVPPGYFNDRSYLNQKQWSELWKLALNVQYTPVV